MTAQPAGRPAPRSEVPFANATPAQVRAALAPEDVDTFDVQWQGAMARATAALDLTDVYATLTAWRRTARVTAALGLDGYRRMVATAEQTLTTGQLPPGTAPVADVHARIVARLSRAPRGADDEPSADEFARRFDGE